MKFLLTTLLILLLACFSCRKPSTMLDADLQALYDTLDIELEQSDFYERDKERRITKIRHEFATVSNSRKSADIVQELIEEYEAYQSDSALYYVNLYLRMPIVRADRHKYFAMLIKKADIASHSGLFSDALHIMHGIDKSMLDSSLLVSYYNTYRGIYQYQSEYSENNEYTKISQEKLALYSDSVAGVSEPGSLQYVISYAPRVIAEGHHEEAETMLFEAIKDYKSGTREYSILASILAYVYLQSGDDKMHKHYLAQTAISDIRAAVKENVSFRELSQAMFEDGDIERADRYLKKSFADANFYSARLRNAQSSRMLPVIDDAYNAKQEEMQGRLSVMVLAVSILAIILVLALILLIRQFSAVKRAGRKLSHANEELTELTAKLSDANRELAAMNEDLKASSNIREEYAGLFMEYCSATISTLQHYHQSLRVLAAQGNKSALIKKLDSSEVIDNALREFYSKFDEAILNIYPSFINKLNALLLPGEEVVLKPDELLNTELRIFALIRIGIQDSATIAQFLRCSITTVYTYRSKLRKRAISPDTFEADIAKISFSHSFASK